MREKDTFEINWEEKQTNADQIEQVLPNTWTLREAAEELKTNVWKAHKSNIYVILNKTNYLTKINNIHDDVRKCKLITRDTTEQLQRKPNKLIATANAIISHQ